MKKKGKEANGTKLLLIVFMRSKRLLFWLAFVLLSGCVFFVVSLRWTSDDEGSLMSSSVLSDNNDDNTAAADELRLQELKLKREVKSLRRQLHDSRGHNASNVAGKCVASAIGLVPGALLYTV